MTLTIKEFRSDPARLAAWAEVLSLPITKAALATLRDNGPEFNPSPHGMSPTDAGVRYGHVLGFAEHHQRLEELAERWPLSPGEAEPTYESPDSTEEE